MNAYTLVLWLHNVLRWFVLIAGVFAVGLAYYGWFSKKEWTRTNRLAGMFFTIGLDVQLLLGLLLYFFLSPITAPVLGNFRGMMADDQLRFFGLEHIFYMVVALIVAHIGSARARRIVEDVRKHRTAAIWFTVSLLVILIAIPWDRPFLRGLGG